jgi:uncharacterized protein (TIGR02001 family)
MKFAKAAKPTSLLLSTLLASVASMPFVATAQTTAPAPAAAAPASPHTFSTNVGLVSDYRYRGLSQSLLKPAVSAGTDYAHESGFYVGAWASSIKWIKDNGGKGNIELDLYGGYKFNVTKEISLDVGFLAYVYPSNELAFSKTVSGLVNADTRELYVAASFGPGTLKYSHSISNLFGFSKSKGSGYLELNGNFDMGDGLTVVAHLGRQSVKDTSAASYTDYKLGVTKDLSGFVVGAALVGTDTDFYVGVKNGKNLGKNSVVLSVSKTF